MMIKPGTLRDPWFLWGAGAMAPSPTPSPPLVARPAWAHSCGGRDGSTMVKLMLVQGQVQFSDPVLPLLISFLLRNLENEYCLSFFPA